MLTKLTLAESVRDMKLELTLVFCCRRHRPEDSAFLHEINEIRDVQKQLRDVEALWVDKYSPQRYTQLLSDEVRCPTCAAQQLA